MSAAVACLVELLRFQTGGPGSIPDGLRDFISILGLDVRPLFVFCHVLALGVGSDILFTTDSGRSVFSCICLMFWIVSPS